MQECQGGRVRDVSLQTNASGTHLDDLLDEVAKALRAGGVEGEPVAPVGGQNRAELLRFDRKRSAQQARLRDAAACGRCAKEGLVRPTVGRSSVVLFTAGRIPQDDSVAAEQEECQTLNVRTRLWHNGTLRHTHRRQP